MNFLILAEHAIAISLIVEKDFPRIAKIKKQIKKNGKLVIGDAALKVTKRRSSVDSPKKKLSCRVIAIYVPVLI